MLLKNHHILLIFNMENIGKKLSTEINSNIKELIYSNLNQSVKKTVILFIIRYIKIQLEFLGNYTL